MFERLTAAVPDVQDINRFTFNREDDAVYVRRMPVEEMTHFEREGGTLRSHWAALRKFSEGCDCLLQCCEPSQPGISSALGEQPLKNCIGLLLGYGRRFNVEGHACDADP